MVHFSVRSALGACLVAIGILGTGGGTALAATPTGTCTTSYLPYTFGQLSAIDSAVTQELFSLIDTNGDGLICFKAYPNGPHAGHAGNLVDDKAAPHT